MILMAFCSGEQYDPDLGLYYLRARYYNPATGRFLNVDPLASQGQRRYEYAAADPVNGMDPTGNADLVEYRPLCCAQAVPFPTFNFNNPPWCQPGPDFSLSNALPPCKPCTDKPGLSPTEARYLCLYYQPMAAKVSTYDVNVALPLGLGIESTFASAGTYLSTGDAFGITGGSLKHMPHVTSPEQDVDLLFSSGTTCGTPSYGERMRGTGSNITLFLQHLELEDAKNNQLTTKPDKNGNVQNLKCMYNSDKLPPTGWKAMVRYGIGEMQKDIPIFLSEQ